MSLKTFLAINVQNIDTKVSAWGITQGWVLTGAFSFFYPKGRWLKKVWAFNWIITVDEVVWLNCVVCFFITRLDVLWVSPLLGVSSQDKCSSSIALFFQATLKWRHTVLTLILIMTMTVSITTVIVTELMAFIEIQPQMWLV